jgi:hypothetical protein
MRIAAKYALGAEAAELALSMHESEYNECKHDGGADPLACSEIPQRRMNDADVGNAEGLRASWPWTTVAT